MEYERFINGAAIREDLRAGRPMEAKIVEIASNGHHFGMSRKGLSIARVKANFEVDITIHNEMWKIVEHEWENL